MSHACKGHKKGRRGGLMMEAILLVYLTSKSMIWPSFLDEVDEDGHIHLFFDGRRVCD